MTDKLEKKYEDQKNEKWGCATINPKACETCIFAHGEPPFADLPTKAYCMIYSRDRGISKPPGVYYEGKPCEYYSKDEE